MITAEKKDLDFLARLNGKESWAALQEERKAKDMEAAKEALAAAERAREEERLAYIAAEDREIKGYLPRMVIQLDGLTVTDPASEHDILCPYCYNELGYGREMVLCIGRRSTLVGERGRPSWYRSASDLAYDTVPAGQGDGLTVTYPTLLFYGQAPCPKCSGPIKIAIECQVEHDGEKVSGIRGQ